MKITMNFMIVGLSMVFSTASFATAETGEVLPNADAVVAKMVQQDAQRKSHLGGYTATRHYVAVNERRKAEMLVKMTCTSDGSKQFTILSENGSSTIRRHVFYKMLKEETEASSRSTSNATHITPANYEFQLIGKDFINERPAYLLQITPKEDNRYLIDGKIWVDATDYSIVRIEGSPARNPSFWTRNVHFVHTYQKVGPFWFASSTHSVSEIRVFGDAELTIENSDYALNPPDSNTAKADFPARIPQ